MSSIRHHNRPGTETDTDLREARSEQAFLLRAQLAAHHHPGQRRQLQRAHEVVEGRNVQSRSKLTGGGCVRVHTRREEVHRLTPARQFRVQGVVQ